MMIDAYDLQKRFKCTREAAEYTLYEIERHLIDHIMYSLSTIPMNSEARFFFNQLPNCASFKYAPPKPKKIFPTPRAKKAKELDNALVSAVADAVLVGIGKARKTGYVAARRAKQSKIKRAT